MANLANLPSCSKFAKADLNVIQKNIYLAIESKVATTIENTVNTLDQAVKSAILSSVGIKKDTWSHEYVFEQKNGSKTPAHIVAEEKVAALLRRDVDRLAQEAYDESIGSIKEAISSYMKKEFKSDFKKTISAIIDIEARAMTDNLFVEAKEGIKRIIEETIKPQLTIGVVDGSYDLSDPNLAESAAAIQAMTVLAEKL